VRLLLLLVVVVVVGTATAVTVFLGVASYLSTDFVSFKFVG